MSTEQMTRFDAPQPGLVDHAFRELDWNERLVGYKMTPSAGNMATDLYNLRDAVLFLVGTRWDDPLLTPGYKGVLNWVDVARLVEWMKGVVGDVELADAIEQEALGLESYKAQNEKIGELLSERMAQYRAVLAPAEEQATAVAV